MDYPFSRPVSKSDFGKATGRSYTTVNRYSKAGILKTVQFPSGELIPAEEANRVIEQGFSDAEIAQLSEFIASQRAKPVGGEGEAA